MDRHSIGEAEAQLSSLIDRVLAGTEVVITRDGVPVVAMRPIAPAVGVARQALAWADAHRVGTGASAMPAGDLVRRMRDEEWER